MKMEVPGDGRMTQDEVYNNMMQQHSPGAPSAPPQQQGIMPPPEQAANIMMGQNNMYSFVAPHLQGHFMPQQPMPNAATAHQGITPKARLQCHACGKLLEYDAGAQYVQCFSCSTMNAVQQKTQIGGRVLSMLCAMCSTTNLAPYGINYVRCGTCHTISQVSHAYRQEISHPGIPSMQPQGQQPRPPYMQPEGGADEGLSSQRPAAQEQGPNQGMSHE
eukprot:Protomagalhaensia_wolfi_Nauph_80__2343@NODE_2539_length_1060_cov_1885_098923_g1744_i3_p1_GENE_NODE_2539_length_1060_cov_1885_098923_g1744_i3NODE_2539_length_1060_cov_1885_098923_g1744_i3_p1_ORF_typecomplete_len218_score12_76zfLSD1/PF06943_12/1_2e03zfLSD1/PF06943_12/1_8e06zfLSD1/PF06943_12/1_4e02zfLSD1/PF06943_12/0_19zinc_ribbon_12/PF11331_8/0_89zinc_ribbon_12/PF11331_8/7_5zinc_ribbon_12/PF11331_8/6_7zinc_ribbon_6/PF14599_6/1_6zinc_ribbon_6/PF14599_6/0_25PriA_CRR/PF18319_1/0_045Mulike_Com/PF10122